MTKPPDLPPLNPKGTWRTYTTADGLAGLQTEHLAEDAEGYLWIGTWDSGACRFDGDEFRTFTTEDGLSGNLVQAILLDRQGRLWFGTDGGVCWWDGKKFHRFDPGDGVSDKLISFIFEDCEGRLWFGGSEALGYYDGSFHDLVPAYGHQHGQPPYSLRDYDECEGIAQDCAGHLWFAFITNLVRYDGEDFHRYGEEHGLPPGRRTVGRDAAGDLWVGAGGALYRCEGQTFQPAPVEVGAYVRKIQRDREGRTWFCTGGRGALCCDGAHFHHFTPHDGLAYSAVNAMYQDREGQIWFATWGGGLSCYDPHSIQVFDEKDGLPSNTVTTLAADHQGRIWVGFGVDLGDSRKTSEVVSCYDGERLTTFGEQEGMGSCLTLYVDSRDCLWCGGLGLRQYESGRFSKIAMGEDLERVVIWDIAKDQKGHLFFGYVKNSSTTQEFFENPLQLTRYDGQRFQTLLTREKRYPYTLIRALVTGRDQSVWFALGVMTGSTRPGEGLGRWHETEGAAYYTVEDGLVDNQVTDLIEDSQGYLWITTSGGISRFDGRGFHNFTMADGLPSNRIYCACQDQQGHLWFGTDNGVVHYDGHTFQAIRSPQITWVIDLLQDRQGRFWFATNKGLVRYTPSRTPPRVRLLQVVADKDYVGVEEVEVPTSTRQIAFEYKGLSFRTHPKDMLYTCRLLGHEEEWQKPSRAMRTLYQDLPMGEYIFEVKAVDRDLNYSETPAMVRVRVHLPYERLAWTLALALAVLLVAWQTGRVVRRDQRLARQNRALEQANAQIQEANQHKSQFLSRMSHDLRTPMNAIIGYTRILLRKAKDALDERQYRNLENIQLSADHLLSLINDILDLSRIEAGRIDLKPEPVDLGEVVAQCAASVESLLKPGVELKQEIADLAPLHTDADRLNRVLMNLLSNAVKFTEAGSITVCVKPAGAWVELSVADTGVGIPAEDLPYIFEEFRQSGRRSEGEKQGSGLGLAIARKSVELLGGSISVESTIGKGTKFTVRLQST